MSLTFNIKHETMEYWRSSYSYQSSIHFTATLNILGQIRNQVDLNSQYAIDFPSSSLGCAWRAKHTVCSIRCQYPGWALRVCTATCLLAIMQSRSSLLGNAQPCRSLVPKLTAGKHLSAVSWNDAVVGVTIINRITDLPASYVTFCRTFICQACKHQMRIFRDDSMPSCCPHCKQSNTIAEELTSRTLQQVSRHLCSSST